MEKYKKTSHRVWECTYHIVWVTKYRYPVLIGDIALRVREVIRQICIDNGVEIIRGRVGKDHIHIQVSIPPYLSVSKLLQYLKGKSSRKIQQEFTQLKQHYWGRHLWAIGYFLRSTGNVTDDIVKQYIESHGHLQDKHGDFQVDP